MKSFFPAGLIVLSAFFLSACSKVKEQVPNIPLTALAEHNNSNYGVYKGLFVGSTGIIVISLRNENENVFATIRIDGTLYQFTTTGILQDGKYTLLEFKNGNNSFIFEVNADGGDPSILSLHIEGHPDAGIILFKERSDALVKCYEGSFEGSQAGTWNIMVRNDELVGLVKTAGNTYTASGTVAIDQSMMGNVSSGAIFEGRFNKNRSAVAGTWENNSGNVKESGEWEGVRTY